MFMPTSCRSNRAAIRLFGLVVVASVGVVACGSENAAPVESDPPTSTPTIGSTAVGSTAPAPVAPRTTLAAGLTELGATAQRLVDIAVADLVERVDLANSTSPIEVVAVDEVSWRDSSLGCPRKDMQYTQVVTPGTRITLAHDGTSYAYHAGNGRDPFYCATPEAPLPNG